MTADKHPTRMLAVAGLLAAPPLLLMMARVLQWADRDTAQATLVEVEGRRLVFSVTADDESGVIGKGTHERFIVNKEGFAGRIESRWTPEES